LDLGTSGTKAYLMDLEGRRVGFGYEPVHRLQAQAGWSELDPWAVVASARSAIGAALASGDHPPEGILALGIASQRDTDFVWDTHTGLPIANAITWQDLRTQPQVEALKTWNHQGELRHRLGYYPGPWCAAMHLHWRQEHQPEWQAAARQGTARMGMAAAWLLAAMGSPNGHLHDYSLIQKTGLWDFRQGRYWTAWIEKLGLAGVDLPQPSPTLGEFGALRVEHHGTKVELPVLAMIGDQQAALFGHGRFSRGEAECTHGTASFIDIVLGDEPVEVEGLNVYHAWSLPAPISGNRFQHTYCLEADTTTSGAAVRWMETRAGFLTEEAGLDRLVEQVADSGGVTFVPAFTGLNVPFNDSRARATILGMDLNTDRAHIARALLESIGYQLRGILETIETQTGLAPTQLSVGGGLSLSNTACQIQADLVGIPVIRPAESETTARGAALLAGLGAGVWHGIQDLPPMPAGHTVFEPRQSQELRDEGYARWQRAADWVQAWGSG
jgi:glycerol kinase